jgi:hypothetical protein
MEQSPQSPDCSRLTLPELRAYRRALDDEEKKVSYWRRIIQARADVTQAGGTLTAGDAQALERVLAGPHARTVHTSLLRVHSGEDAPSLPDIAALWTRLDSPSDQAARSSLVHDLREAESQLSTYRHDLHRRIRAATAEAIARYRADPSLCLSALPQHQATAPRPRTDLAPLDC